MSFYTNIDCNTAIWPFLRAVEGKGTVTKEMLYPIVDCYKDTQITDILFNIFVQVSATDSDVFSDYAFKYEQTIENGVTVDYKSYFDALYIINKQHHIDPYAVWIDRVRQNGMKAWISIRMNDAHLPFDEAAFLRPDFFYEAREKGWMIGEGYGPCSYFKNCFNYAYKEIRDKFLAYIDEQLTRYDCDGIELDFMRDIFCFPYDKFDGTQIMTQFMRDAKALVVKHEKRRGHGIRIGVRLTRDIEQSLKYGFDARAFDREGLCDLIVVTPRWCTNDSHMKIAEWKKECPHVELAAGLEIMTAVLPAEGSQKTTTAAVARGFAAHDFAEGADSFYLFNYFLCPNVENPTIPEEKHFSYYPKYGDEAYDSLCNEVNNTCGAYETAVSHPRRYLLTFQESEICPKGMKRFAPLPMNIGFEQVRFRMNCGAIKEGQRAALLLGFEKGGVQDIELFVNGVKIFAFEQTDRGVVETDAPDVYALPGTVLYKAALPKGTDGNMMIAVRNVGDNPVVLTCFCVDIL